MLFVISYRKKHASSKSRKSFFAEHDKQPSEAQIRGLVNSVSGGNYAEHTIALQKFPGFEADELTRAGITVVRFEAEAPIDSTSDSSEAPIRESKHDEAG